jgi:high-affinity nickel permease
LGLVLGVQHALDADRLTSVSTIISEHKKFNSASLPGAFLSWEISAEIGLL